MTTRGCQHQLIEAQVQRTPGATAAVCATASLTYADLDRKANQLAHHLKGLGVEPDVLVGVSLSRSLDLAVALLAVLKAGGACVPLDPSLPETRLDFMVKDAGLPLVLTHEATAGRLVSAGVRLIGLDLDAHAWSCEPDVSPSPQPTEDDVAYVIYTSGSTGRPKGVQLTHRALVNHHLAAIDLYGLGPGDRVLQFCSLGFDASIEELFPTWAAGATVVFRSEEVPIVGRDWLRWLRDQCISVLNLPTAYWHAWVRDLERLGEAVPAAVRLVVVGGEKARGSTYRRWLTVGGAAIRWVNAYGPTEATCMSTVFEYPASAPQGRGDPPIGCPLPNVVVRVVDSDGKRATLGATGELLIGGAGLARSYLNQPELTAERFIPDPQDEAERVFRTGDLVRELPSGDLDYIGRLDEQVKIQGFRVECGEVEAALGRHPSVAEAVVVARETRPGDRQLVAYVVASGSATADAADAASLRRFLAHRLPHHMVPSSFVGVSGFPLSPNGKVDRARLRQTELAHRPLLSGPQTPTEKRLAAIWTRVLGHHDFGLNDDFFELGGHSLLAAQVIALIREEFDTETPLRAIFESPTVAALARLIGAPRLGPIAPLVAQLRSPGELLPLSLAQEQMWTLERAASPPGLYNITAIRRFDEPVEQDDLRAALAFMSSRHETLRTSFVERDAGPAQIVLAGIAIALAVTDLRTRPTVDRETEFNVRLAELDALPFDLSRAPLVRAHLFHLDEATDRLAVTFDHLVSDGRSVAIFMEELAETYRAISDRRIPALRPLDVQFGDFAVWQRQFITEEILQAQADWWVGHLQGMPLGPAVPFDRIPTEASRQISQVNFVVGPETYRLLDRQARASHSSVFVVCAAAVSCLFSRIAGLTDIVLSTTLNGRHRVELEHLICMFAGVGRVRTDLSGDPPMAEIISRTRASVLGMLDHQDVPFMRVRRRLFPDFPRGGLELAAALPIEFAYFPTPAGFDDHELFFRGQLHPLSVTVHDDGSTLRVQLSYKVAFYDQATIARLREGLNAILVAVATDPRLHLSQLPLGLSISSPGDVR